MSEFISISEYNKDIHGNEVTVKCSPLKFPELSFDAVNVQGSWFTSYPDGVLRTCTPVLFTPSKLPTT